MSKPAVDAFFIGRAVAEGIYEQLESLFTNALSELGKFDAEQRENIRQFTEQVVARADREAEVALQNNSAPGMSVVSGPTISPSTPSVDWQEVIDGLRAEVAQLRSELQRYRNQS
ncbi:MAG: DUF6825 family protein [Microcoleaceae cyanobacterium]